MCNSRPTLLITPAETPKAEEEKRDPATLNPQKKACLAKLFMHNPQFAETFFKARIGKEGMIRFHALQAHISKMPDEGLKVIMDQRVVGTLTLLSQFFDPSESDSVPSPSTRTLETGIQMEKDGDGEMEIEGEKGVRVKMNKWCWIFLGAWTVGEAGRVLARRTQSCGKIST